MGKINPFCPKRVLAAIFLICISAACGQVVNRSAVEHFLIEGEVGKAQKTLESYLGSADLTYPDSVYILKNLGVLYSSSPKRKDLGDRYFFRLLDLDPFASIHDTYAGNSILARFKKIRKDYQRQKGGKALVPAVVVFDFHGEGLKENDGVAMAQQFIAEMQRLEVFHTLDRSNVVETMDKMRLQPDKCMSRECRLDIARRLTADKLVTVQASRLDTVFTFTLAYLDVETGEAGTTLNKVYAKSPEKLLAEGFGELALELQSHEAAFLNLSVTPLNTVLTIDNSPMAVISSRVPLNPGKHRICGSSPGYETECKDFEVKRADALTYSLALPAKAGTQVQADKPPSDEDADEEDPNAETGETGASHTFVWWTLGAMAVLAVTLALVFNTKN
ncbi:MAG TPA: hypothetical protein VJ385_16470 [Fibrobacteria bacterium]|nr:hypothetical protein [Fibrobacteria bacterium]